MPATRLLHRGAVDVIEYVCGAGTSAPPVAEQHQAWSISYVRRGSFGCSCRGHHFQLVPGSVLVGRPGDEFVCTHDHHDGGDECLAFFFKPESIDELRAGSPSWPSEARPPIAELTSLGELAQSAVLRNHDTAHDTAHDIALDEIGFVMAARYLGLSARHKRGPVDARPKDQRRVVDSALWIGAHSAEPITLDDMADAAGLSPYHYLRVFSAVLAVTPHQFLVRSRLRKAARLLLDGDLAVTDIALEVGFRDLSNFVRSFHRTAGVSPRVFRGAAKGTAREATARFFQG